MKDREETLFQVKATSNTVTMADAMSATLQKHKILDVHAAGKAIQQATKALASASYMIEKKTPYKVLMDVRFDSVYLKAHFTNLQVSDLRKSVMSREKLRENGYIYLDKSPSEGEKKELSILHFHVVLVDKGELPDGFSTRQRGD